MSLLQIQEPNAPPDKTDFRLALGIDLGTTNSLVAIINDNGQAETLPDEKGRMILPSLVRYDKDGRVTVGEEARTVDNGDAQSVIASVKRLMGRAAKEVGDDYRYDYAAEEGMVKISTVAGEKSPVEVSAEILRHLARRAKTATGQQVADAVITVPAYFDEAQRQATAVAAKLAGLRVLRLLNEPTAAAVAYGLDNAEEGIYAIYDLGGGTFDISILRLQQGVFEVLATGGDTVLGGDDYDRALAMMAAKKMGITEFSDEDFWRLTAAARIAKEALNKTTNVILKAPLSMGEKTCELDTVELAEAGKDLTAKTLSASHRALIDAGLSAEQLDGVILVGGATRMSAVRNAVTEFFGKTPYTGLDPDRVVALGAAAQADVLIGNRRNDNWLLLDVIPLSLGLETMGGLSEKIIHRNSTIPVSRSQEFTTHQDGQTMMSIHVLQGERELAADCRSLAKFTLSGIPPLTAAQARVRVNFQVDADGLLLVSATEKSTDAAANVAVKPSYGLDEAQISAMLVNSFSHAEEDVVKRRLSEARYEAKTLIQLIEKALHKDGGLLNDNERIVIDEHLTALKKAVNNEGAENIKAATKALDAACATFAERRMNASIRKALGGKSIF